MASRLYFPLDEAAAVSPAIDTSAGAWDGHVNTLRRRLRSTTDTSALTTVAYTPDGSDHGGDLNAHHRQYVGDVAGPQTFTGTFKAQFQGLQANANSNQRLTIRILLVTEDGSSVLAVLFAATRDDNEWVVTTLTNRLYTGTLTQYVSSVNGRVVVEVGTGGNPAGGGGVQGHNAQIRWGCSASSGDLAENDTETGTTWRPWIEFSMDILPPSEAKSGSDTGSGAEGTSAVLMTTTRAETGAGAEGTTGLLATLAATGETGAGADAAALLASLIGADVGAGVEGAVDLFILYTITGEDAGSGAEGAADLLALLTRPDVGAGLDVGALLAILAGGETGGGLDAREDPLAIHLRAETGISVDTVAALFAALTATETAVGADVAAVLGLLSQTEAGGGAEGAAGMAASVLGIESAAGLDLSSLQAVISAVEVATGSDVAAVLAILLRAETNAGVVETSDVEVSGGTVPKADDDTGAGAEGTTTLLVFLGPGETGAGVDAAQVLAVITATDVGVGADAAALMNLVAGQDAGVGVDAAEVAVLLLRTETGMGAEAAALFATLAGAEVGTGVDFGEKTEGGVIPKSGADFGVGVDVAVLLAFPRLRYRESRRYLIEAEARRLIRRFARGAGIKTRFH